jgi:hypothetical protein
MCMCMFPVMWSSYVLHIWSSFVLYVKQIRYQFWCTRCAFRLLSFVRSSCVLYVVFVCDICGLRVCRMWSLLLLEAPLIRRPCHMYVSEICVNPVSTILIWRAFSFHSPSSCRYSLCGFQGEEKYREVCSKLLNTNTQATTYMYSFNTDFFSSFITQEMTKISNSEQPQ